MSIFKLITVDQFPREYVEHCQNGQYPTTLDEVVPIYKSPVNGAYDLEDKLYACWCWATFCKQYTFRPIAVQLRVTPESLRNWVREYAEPEWLAYCAVQGAKRSESLRSCDTEEAIERMLRKVLRAASKKIDGAGFSQLIIGYGVLSDKLRALRATPKKQMDVDIQERLSGLSDEAVKEILAIIERDRQQAKVGIEDAEYRVTESPPEVVEAPDDRELSGSGEES